jgi:DNA polymerase-3 subunit delta'
MNEDRLVSHILVCQDLEKAKEHIETTYSSYRLVFFFPEKEFSIEDSKAVLKEAYIAESKPKIIALGAHTYNIYSQNSLLKILEEPPMNIIFILVATSKTGFLPTIRSRMSLQELKIEKQTRSSGLNLAKLEVNDIYEYVQKNSKISKQELKEQVQTIISEAILTYKLSFSEKELGYFQSLLELIELNTRAQNILSSLLLNIMLRKRK